MHHRTHALRQPHRPQLASAAQPFHDRLVAEFSQRLFAARLLHSLRRGEHSAGMHTRLLSILHVCLLAWSMPQSSPRLFIALLRSLRCYSFKLSLAHLCSLKLLLIAARRRTAAPRRYWTHRSHLGSWRCMFVDWKQGFLV